MEASTLAVFTYQGSINMKYLVEQISGMENYGISDRLHIDGLESRLNAGAGELLIGEVIFRSLEYLKSHIVEVQVEASML